VSDQDFFFDEESAKTEKAAEKPAKSSASKSPEKSAPAKSGAAKSAPAPVATPFFEQNVSMSVVGMLVVIGILVGVILGYLIGGAGSLSVDTAVTVPAGSTGTAPLLTPEQQGGPLPSGHPSIGGTASGTTVPTATK